jgi:polysaccharide biosynthesis protein PslH
VPFAPRFDAPHGGGQVVVQLLSRLALRHQVSILALRAPDDPPCDEEMRRRCVRVEEMIRPGKGGSSIERWKERLRHARSLAARRPLWVGDCAVRELDVRVREIARAWQPDVIQLEYHVMGQYLSALGACRAPRVVSVYEPGTVAARHAWRASHGVERPLRWADMLAWHRYEAAILAQVQSVVAFTEEDREVLVALQPRASVTCIRPGIQLPAEPLSSLGDGTQEILFLGSFTHPPNIDAAVRLTRAIFPEVLRRCPEARLTIVGGSPPPSVMELAGDRVRVTGWVPDVVPYLNRAAVLAAPLRLGGGIRIKVLEALAAGKAIVATPLAVAGLELENGIQAAIANSDDEIAHAIISLLTDPRRREKLATRARAWALDNLAWDTSVAAYERIYDKLLGTPDGRDSTA